MQAEIERQYDEYDRMATYAMWNRAAYHAKKLNKLELFKRPDGEEKFDRKSLEEQRREVDEMNEWLATLTVERKG